MPEGRSSEAGARERRRREDTIEMQLDDTREQLRSVVDRMDGMHGRMDHVESDLTELKKTNVLIAEHIKTTCELATAASVVVKPIVLLIKGVRLVTMWFGAWVVAVTAAVLGIVALGEKLKWW